MLRLKVWTQASRPKTLIASASPVLVGAALALNTGLFDLTAFLFTMATALCIQIGTNFANDYFDFVKGADTSARKGPLRVTQAGLVSLREIKVATAITFILAALFGCYLIWHSSIAIAFLLALSILFGIIYTGGPYPLAYLGLGELFVFIFFGPIAVASTFYLQTQQFSWEAVLAGIPLGALSSAILVVNNLRDIEEDRAAGKKTLSVRFGKAFGKFQFTLAIFLAFIPLPFFFRKNPFSMLAVMALLPALSVLLAILKNKDPLLLNEALAKTARLLFIYTLLFCIGWML